MSFFFLLNTKEDILKNDLNQRVVWHLVERKKKYWKSMVPKFQSFFKISSLVFSRREKLIQVYNNLRVGKLQNLNFFGLSIPIISHLNLRSKMCFIHNCFMLYSFITFNLHKVGLKQCGHFHLNMMKIAPFPTMQVKI